jgi:hypothetical protein
MKSGQFRYEFRSTFTLTTTEGKQEPMIGTHNGLFVGTEEEAREQCKSIADDIVGKYPSAAKIKVRHFAKEAVATQLSLELSHLRKTSQSFALALHLACENWIEGKPVPSMDPKACIQQMLHAAYEKIMPGAYQNGNVIVGPDGQAPLQGLAMPSPEGQQVTLQ